MQALTLHQCWNNELLLATGTLNICIYSYIHILFSKEKVDGVRTCSYVSRACRSLGLALESAVAALGTVLDRHSLKLLC